MAGSSCFHSSFSRSVLPVRLTVPTGYMSSFLALYIVLRYIYPTRVVLKSVLGILILGRRLGSVVLQRISVDHE